MNRLYCIILMIFLFGLSQVKSQAPNWAWAKKFGGSLEENGASITSDSNGNIYVAGNFASPSIVIGNSTLINNGSADFFIAKFDSTGNPLWAKSYGGSQTDYCNYIYCDKNNNVIVIGCFHSTSLNIGGYNLTNKGYRDFFLTKLDSYGNVLWAKSAGGTKEDNGYSLSTDAYNNIYITGTFYSPSISFGSYTLTNQDITGNTTDLFIVKYDPMGNVFWAKTAVGDGYEISNSITIDNLGCMYITGEYTGTHITFDGIRLDKMGGGDIFTAKYNSTANIVWAKSAGGGHGASGFCVKTDKFANIYITGSFVGNLSFHDTIILNKDASGNNEDVFFAKYDSSGNFDWAYGIGEHANDYAYHIAIDTLGGTYLLGAFSGSAMVVGNDTLICNGSFDMFIAKYNPAGYEVWALNVGGSDIDISESIVIDMVGNLYLTGFYRSPSILFGNITLMNAGVTDAFIAKLNPNNGNSIIEISFDNEKSARIFPNPSSGDYTLIVPPKTKDVRILNATGQLIQKLTIEKELIFNLTLNKSGVYFVQITSDKQIQFKKIIISN